MALLMVQAAMLFHAVGYCLSINAGITFTLVVDGSILQSLAELAEAETDNPRIWADMQHRRHGVLSIFPGTTLSSWLLFLYRHHEGSKLIIKPLWLHTHLQFLLLTASAILEYGVLQSLQRQDAGPWHGVHQLADFRTKSRQKAFTLSRCSTSNADKIISGG